MINCKNCYLKVEKLFDKILSSTSCFIKKTSLIMLVTKVLLEVDLDKQQVKKNSKQLRNVRGINSKCLEIENN